MFEINTSAKKRHKRTLSVTLKVPIMAYDEDETKDMIDKYIQHSEELETLVSSLEESLKVGIYKLIPKEHCV